MATNIPYVDEVWNPIVGCSKCSPGCENCWAEKFAARLAGMECASMKGFTVPTKSQRRYVDVTKMWHDPKKEKTYFNGWNGKIVCDEKALDKPLHWRKPRKILTCSMGDWCHPNVPLEFRDKMMAVAALCPQHDFWFLTKRVKKMAEYIPGRDWGEACNKILGKNMHLQNEIVPPLPNVHLGATICNQKEADEKIPILLSIPAAHRWLSIEPLLGKVKLTRIKTPERTLDALRGKSKYYVDGNTPYYGYSISQVIIGCESGPKRRPCKREWIKSLVKQCKSAGVPYMVKQMAENEDGTGKVIHDLERIKAILGD